MKNSLEGSNIILFKLTIHAPPTPTFFLKVCSIIVSHQQFREFVEKGLDLMSVAPLERSSLKNILQMVPTHLKKLRAPLEQLLREINDGYLLSVKRASGMSSTKIKVWHSGTDITWVNWHSFFGLQLQWNIHSDTQRWMKRENPVSCHLTDRSKLVGHKGECWTYVLPVSLLHSVFLTYLGWSLISKCYFQDWRYIQNPGGWPSSRQRGRW